MSQSQNRFDEDEDIHHGLTYRTETYANSADLREDAPGRRRRGWTLRTVSVRATGIVYAEWTR